MTTRPALDPFAAAYLACLLWSSNDGDDWPADEYGEDDLADEALAALVSQCRDFAAHYAETWRAAGWTDEQAAHDFALTRNHHGAGFWDRGNGPAGDELTAAAHAYGETSPYIGDDGRVYL